MPLSPKSVSDSAVHEHIYKIFPNDLNSNDTVFGGQVMAICDRVALVVAERHTGRVCVTASIDSVHFLAPAMRGETLIFRAAINRSWRSSMEIGLRVEAEDVKTGNRKHIISAYFTFVALNEEQKPTPVPAIAPENAIEKRRFEEADIRRNNRKQESEQLQQHRSQPG